jgi:flagellin-like protein
MKIWGKNERSWRRKNRRAVSPIIATILLVAITVVLAAVLYILIQQYTKGGAATPLGTAFSFSGSTDAASTANNYYNMTIESTSPTLNFGDLIFQLKTPAGGVFVTGVSVSVVNSLGVVEGAFCIGTITTGGVACAGTQAWVFNAANAKDNCNAPSFTSVCSTTAIISTASYLSVAVTPLATSLSGYTLIALGQSAYGGSVSGPIT